MKRTNWIERWVVPLLFSIFWSSDRGHTFQIDLCEHSKIETFNAEIVIAMIWDLRNILSGRLPLSDRNFPVSKKYEYYESEIQNHTSM